MSKRILKCKWNGTQHTKCSTLRQFINPVDSKKKGMKDCVVDGKYYGVLYVNSSVDSGTEMNYCPFCGERLNHIIRTRPQESAIIKEKPRGITTWTVEVPNHTRHELVVRNGNPLSRVPFINDNNTITFYFEETEKDKVVIAKFFREDV